MKVFYCDHCGRQIDDKKGTLGLDITSEAKFLCIKTDLCNSCYAELYKLLERFLSNDKKNKAKECKNCQYCDVIKNQCFLHLEADCCYKEGKCMVENCPAFKEGEWSPQ